MALSFSKKKPTAAREEEAPEPEVDEEYDQFKVGLRIDRHSLDDELVQSAPMYQELQEAFIRAKTVAEDAKLNSDQEYSRAGVRVRKQLGDSVTEPKVKEGIAVDEGYLASLVRYQELRKRADRFGALVSSFEKKNRDLHKLCELFMSNYYVRNSVSEESREAKDRVEHSTRAALAGSRKPVVAVRQTARGK